MKFVIEKNVEIQAPASVVWETLTDFPRYGEWNPFVLKCETTLQPGTPIRMDVALVGTQKVDEVIESCTPGTGFAYHMKPYPLGALSSRRSHEIKPLAADRAQYTSYFHLEGWLMPLVRLIMRPKLEAGFAGMTAGLRQRSEQLWTQRRAKAA